MNYQKHTIGPKISILTLSVSFIILFAVSLPVVYAQLQQGPVGSVPPLPDRINLSISNITVIESPTGLTAIDGIILNNSTENVNDVKVDIILLDSLNKTIEDTTRSITSSLSTMEPGATVSFSFLMSTTDFDHYDARSYGLRTE
ncbi:MAG TPA: FxLYD domain-containing protein [Candidatus Nitrosocosmicus sp.]|nr:FxLYD domain-containing protein [Candidatus Nitrosocosmicus sp.]